MASDHADPRKAAEIGLLGLLPVLLGGWVALLAARTGNYAVDFRGELYPEAKLVVHGADPFPSTSAVLHFPALIWPVPAAVLISPFTALSPTHAGAVFSLLLVASIVGTLAILGIRDWRIYGLVALWPAAISSVQAGNVTPILALLLAIAWTARERRFIPGIAIGLCIALKLFLFPMIVWLLATRRWAAAAAAAVLSVATAISMIPFIGLADYAQLMNHLSQTEGPRSLGLIGFFSQTGLPFRTAELVGSFAAVAVLFLAWRRRSLTLALAGSLLLTPIIWLHYFVLLVIPLAIRSRTLSPVWLLPLALWGGSSVANNGTLWQSAIALACLSIVVVVAEFNAPADEILSKLRLRLVGVFGPAEA